jgi:hypothetical protein
MLALVLPFLVILMGVVTAMWLFSLVSNRPGFKQTALSGLGSKILRKLKAQQGFLSLASSSWDGAKHQRLRNPKNSLKTPWGW